MMLVLRTLFINLLISITPLFSQDVEMAIYNEDSVLSDAFVNALCSKARTNNNSEYKSALKLKNLILKASGTTESDTLKQNKVRQWHQKYASQCMCKAVKGFERGDFIRQAVINNNRTFANWIGPNKELPLFLAYKDPVDQMNILEFIDHRRKALEERHDNKRFEFQQDEEWRNIMFFYFLFSEYSIN